MQNYQKKISFVLLDYTNQNAGSQPRQGFQHLQALGILIKSIVAVQRTYILYLTLSCFVADLSSDGLLPAGEQDVGSGYESDFDVFFIRKSTVKLFCSRTSPLYFSLVRMDLMTVGLQFFLPLGVGMPSPVRILAMP